MTRSCFAAALFATLSLPALAQAQSAQTYEAPIIGAKSNPIGKLAIRSSENATIVRITIEAGGLAPGWHGVHFHSVGDCSDVGKFELSKGHVNHENAQHGLLNPEGPEEGDLPNLYAAADGSANAELSSESIVLMGPQGLKDGDGSALVIHASEDDHTSQPIGNAGARVACAVIK
jgi:Cu-Zn family superoxide dismutase